MVEFPPMMAPYHGNWLSFTMNVVLENKCAFKKQDEWWMVDVNDIVCTLKPPNKEKVSGTRSIFFFEDFEEK